MKPRNYINRRVNSFSAEMKKKLELNNHKGDWKDDSFQKLLDGFNEEVRELQEAIFNPNKSKEDAMSECVDVANTAMFIYQKLNHQIK